MEIKTHLGRITAPISYVAVGGEKHHIPIGPCLLESQGDSLIDVIWGERGQCDAALPLADIKVARDQGHLVLLD